MFFDCSFLQTKITPITMVTIAATTKRTTTHKVVKITVTSVGESIELEDGSPGESAGRSVVGDAGRSVEGSVGGAVEATGHLSGSRESITTGHVGSTCSCVEATMM